MIWQDISTTSSKRSKVKKKGGDGIPLGPNTAELQGCYGWFLLVNIVVCSLSLSLSLSACARMLKFTCLIIW